MKYIRKYNKDGVIKESLSKIEGDLDNLILNIKRESRIYLKPISDMIETIWDVILNKDDDNDFIGGQIKVDFIRLETSHKKYEYDDGYSLLTIGVNSNLELEFHINDDSSIKDLRDLLNIKKYNGKAEIKIDLGTTKSYDIFRKVLPEIENEILSFYKYVKIEHLKYTTGKISIKIEFDMKNLLNH